MASLYDDLSARLERDPRLTRRGGARPDLGLLLFNARESLNELWKAADGHTRSPDDAALRKLHDALDRLRPIFGEPRGR